jgi:hypothetical protein
VDPAHDLAESASISLSRVVSSGAAGGFVGVETADEGDAGIVEARRVLGEVRATSCGHSRRASFRSANTVAAWRVASRHAAKACAVSALISPAPGDGVDVDALARQLGEHLQLANRMHGLAASDSPWFSGPLRLVLRAPAPCEFYTVHGGGWGYFEWDRAQDDSVPKTARWMREPMQLDMMEWLDAQDRPQKRASEPLAAL